MKKYSGIIYNIIMIPFILLPFLAALIWLYYQFAISPKSESIIVFIFAMLVFSVMFYAIIIRMITNQLIYMGIDIDKKKDKNKSNFMVYLYHKISDQPWKPIGIIFLFLMFWLLLIYII
jgi:hypothetical protein